MEDEHICDRCGGNLNSDFPNESICQQCYHELQQEAYEEQEQEPTDDMISDGAGVHWD